jgi:hypothetical protein
MTIKIHELEFITAFKVEQIINYYNAYRPEGAEPLEQREGGGGFMIPVKGAVPEYMPKSQCYKQLKWHKNILVTYIDYAGFSTEEEALLYEAMATVLSDKYVKRYNAFSEALMSSPRFLELEATAAVMKNKTK